MTADIEPQMKPAGFSTMLPTLTLIFAGLTLFFALLSMALGNRVSTLHTHYLKTEKESAASEAASIQGLETKLNAVTSDLETAQQALAAQKTASGQLRRQLAVAMEDLKHTQTELNSANQVITRLESSLPAPLTPPAEALQSEPTPQTQPSTETDPSQQPPPQSALPQPTLGKPTTVPVDMSKKQIDDATPPATAVIPSDRGAADSKKSSTSNSQPAPVAAPASE